MTSVPGAPAFTSLPVPSPRTPGSVRGAAGEFVSSRCPGRLSRAELGPSPVLGLGPDTRWPLPSSLFPGRVEGAGRGDGWREPPTEAVEGGVRNRVSARPPGVGKPCPEKAAQWHPPPPNLADHASWERKRPACHSFCFFNFSVGKLVSCSKEPQTFGTQNKEGPLFKYKQQKCGLVRIERVGEPVSLEKLSGSIFLMTRRVMFNKTTDLKK